MGKKDNKSGNNVSVKRAALVDQGNRNRKGVLSKRRTSSKHFDNYLKYELSLL